MDFGLTSSLLGGAAGVLGSLFGSGSKPNLPPYLAVDTTQEQANAISGNARNLPAAQQLASQVNTFNYDQLQAMLGKSIPGFSQIQQQTSDIISSQLKGEIPKDVQDAIQNNAASKAVAGGYAGTGIHGNLVARDLGLTSLDLTNKAVDSAERWMSMTRQNFMPNQFDITGMMISPAQRIATETQNRMVQSGISQSQAMINAAPNPILGNMGTLLSGMGGKILGAGLMTYLAPQQQALSGGLFNPYNQPQPIYTSIPYGTPS